MDNLNNILEQARETIRLEAAAVSQLEHQIDSAFAKAATHIHQSGGRVVITGIGKSAIIAQKIVATMNSTGTPAIFMHAADAIHGDLGNIQQSDTVICISKSGNTPEIKVLVPLIKDFGNTLIGLTGNPDSFLGQQSDYVLNAHIEKEACPNNLAPTTSTTAQLVIGDALAVALLDLKGFTSNDFARYHPGGALGKKLYLRVKDLVDAENIPAVEVDTPIRAVLLEISKKMLGVTAVLDGGQLVGVITDGDLRRMMSKHEDMGALNNLTAADIMSKSPKTIAYNAMAVDAKQRLEESGITQLLVTDKNDVYMGVVHLHDLIREGIV